MLGPSGIVNGVRFTFNQINGLQSGQIYHYLFIFLISTLFLILLPTLFSNFIMQLSSILFLLVVMFLI